MVRAIVFAAIIALVAIYSRGAAAKTPVNPSMVEPEIAKRTKNTEDENRSDDRLHHRGRRSPGGDVGRSDDSSSDGDHDPSSLSIASDSHAVPVDVYGRKRRRKRLSEFQTFQLQRTFDGKKYLTPAERRCLAVSLGLEEQTIAKWFNNRRWEYKIKCPAMSGPSGSGSSIGNAVPVGGADQKRRYIRLSKSQLFRLNSVFDLRPYITSAESKHLAVSLGLEEQKIVSWFQKRRHQWKSEHANVALANQRLSRMPTFHYDATVSGPSGSGIGGSQASSSASSSVSDDFPRRVVADVGTSDCGIITGRPGIFHSHHQHQHEQYPSHIEAQNIRTHQVPAISDFHQHHQNDHHPSFVQAHNIPSHQIPGIFDSHHQHQNDHNPSHVVADNVPTHLIPATADSHFYVRYLSEQYDRLLDRRITNVHRSGSR